MKKEWEKIGWIQLFHHTRTKITPIDENIVSTLMKNPGKNITTMMNGYLYRAVWSPPEGYNGEKWADSYYCWYRKKPTKKELEDYKKHTSK
jgi:hypothetical protein